jgi:hypothetical protein
MTTNAHLWPYLAQFSLEWEMFQTVVVEKIKTSILCSITFFWTLFRLWDNMEKFGRDRQVTEENTCITHRMRIACWITMATDIHSEYVIFTAFPLQSWLRERATILRCSLRTFSVLLSLTARIHCCTSNSDHSQKYLRQKWQWVTNKEHLKACDCWG